MRSLLQELVSLASPSSCTRCELKNSLRILRQLRSRQCSPLRARFASSLASSTAINATKEIPLAFQELHRALEKLKRDAPSYVNLSRLQLALRGLESAAPVTRIAVLGLQHQKSARRLARLLLADPLTDEGDWERKLEDLGADDRGSLLLRYGDERDPPNTTSLVTTLHIPSRILLRNNLEVLISTINLPSHPTPEMNNAEALKNAALVPTAEAPKSFSGSISFITYPVHRALVLADGLEGLLVLGRFLPEETTAAAIHDPIKLAVEFPALAGTSKKGTSSFDIAMLDVSLAKQALDKFRLSTSNAEQYEEGWYSSGMPSVTSWFSPLAPESSESDVIHPAVAELVLDIITSASKSLVEEHQSKLQASLSSSAPAISRQPLAEALKVWALRAHTEMRDKLDAAFASHKWAKLKWWKLIWRVDDITMISEELVQRCWLVDSEKGIIWLAGRAVEAGLYDVKPEESVLSDTVSTPATMTPLPTESVTAVSPPPVQPTSTPVSSSPAAPPWPTTIPLARTNLIAASIPPLQALAQRLLVQTFSITTTSVALSALFYVSFPAASLYSVGAIAAFGFVFGLRRMQRKWEDARTMWEDEVREAGRRVLRDLEGQYEQGILAEEGKEKVVLLEGEVERKVAAEAVEEVRSILQGLR